MNINRKQFVLVLMTGFLGGALSHLWFSPKTINAESGTPLKTNHLRIVDNNGVVKGDLYTGDDMGALLNLNGFDGKYRVQLGSYGDEYSAAERGQPLIGLFDNSANLRMLFRLAGKNESPVLIFKDRQHRDRIVFGLGLNDKSEEPFFAYFDKAGKKHLLFGEY